MESNLLHNRFWSKTQKNGDCIEWSAHRSSKGYGEFYFNGHTRRAHRISWIITNGEIPEGMLVCHRCDNPPCVNPEHLFLGSPKVNMVDRVHKGHYPKNSPRIGGERNRLHKLTDASVLEAKALRPTMTLRELASRYGVHIAVIHRAITGKTWKHLTNVDFAASVTGVGMGA